jgi:hypothetical protein
MKNNATTAIMWAFPWITPIPTAWLIGRSTFVHLEWPVLIAAIAALIIEGFGFSAVSTALMLREYNRTRRKADPAAPVWLAYLLVVIYFVAAISLTILMDIIPALAVYAPAVFPVFSLSGMTIAALLHDHRQRLAEIEAGKAEQKAERAARKAEREQASSKPETEQAEQKEKYICPVCSASFEKQKALNGHMLKHAAERRNGHKELAVSRDTEK